MFFIDFPLTDDASIVKRSEERFSRGHHVQIIEIEANRRNHPAARRSKED